MCRKPNPKECLVCASGWASTYPHEMVCNEKEAWADDNRVTVSDSDTCLGFKPMDRRISFGRELKK